MGNQPTSLTDPLVTTSTSATPAPSSLKTQPPSITTSGSSTANRSIKLDGFVKRLSLTKKLYGSKSKKKKTNYYAVPPNAERPSPPSRPEVFQDQDQYFVLRWEAPAFDGGCPLMGYVIQHLELGLPQLDNQEQDDTEGWYSSEPGQITQTECLLNNLIPGTTYEFRVVAENLIGYSLPSEVSEAIVFNPHGELDDWFFPPEFCNATLEDKYTVMEHEMLTLSVEVKGQPYPTVRWMDQHGQDLTTQKNKRYKTRSSGFTRRLVISGVELTDAGKITCSATNSEGQIECSTVLYVEAPPRIRRVQNPEFLQNPYDVNEREEERLNTFLGDDYEDLIFQAGELVRLKFLFSGSPKPDLSIYHDGQLITDPRIATEFTDKVITVKIENIDRYDRGEWLVKLENDLGEDATSVLITITDHPCAPGKPEILQLSDNTCILRWDEPTDDGGCPIHNFIVEYFRSEWGVWLKSCTSKNAGAKIKDLIEGSKYRFRVKAENLYGVSEASEESAEILITESPSSRNTEVLMPSLEESIEEEPMEILSHSDFQDDEQYSPPPFPERKNKPSFAAPPSPRPQKASISTTNPASSPSATSTDPNKKLYSRGDVIKSAVTSSVNYVQRFLDETGHASPSAPSPTSPTTSDLVDYDEYDFEKLEKEYEAEMRELRDQLGATSEEEEDEFDDEDVDDDETAEEGEDVKIYKTGITPEEDATTYEKHSPSPIKVKDYEEEFIWPKRKARTVDKPKPVTLGDRFTDYLTMKTTKIRRFGSKTSLTSSGNDPKSDNTASRENLKRLLDFDPDYDDGGRSSTPGSKQSPQPPAEPEDVDAAVQIHEVRRAIILHEEKLEAERIEREKLKELERLAAIEREAALEARRKANRKQKSEEVVEEEVVKVYLDPEKVARAVMISILILMIPIYWYYDVWVMLLAFVICLLLRNKFR